MESDWNDFSLTKMSNILWWMWRKSSPKNAEAEFGKRLTQIRLRDEKAQVLRKRGIYTNLWLDDFVIHLLFIILSGNPPPPPVKCEISLVRRLEGWPFRHVYCECSHSHTLVLCRRLCEMSQSAGHTILLYFIKHNNTMELRWPQFW